MLSLVKDNETKLDSLTQAMEHLHQAHLSIVNDEAYSNFQQLLTVGSQARCAIYQDRILNSLKFNEMCQRYDAIHGPHENTFAWIYEPADAIHNSLSTCWPHLYDTMSSKQTLEV